MSVNTPSPVVATTNASRYPPIPPLEGKVILAEKSLLKKDSSHALKPKAHVVWLPSYQFKTSTRSLLINNNNNYYKYSHSAGCLNSNSGHLQNGLSLTRFVSDSIKSSLRF